MRTEFKGILNEEAAHTTSPVRIFSPTLEEAIHISQHEIGAGISGIVRSPKAEVAVLPVGVPGVKSALQKVATDGQLVAALYPVDAVRNLPGASVIISRMPGADREVSAYRDNDFGRRGMGQAVNAETGQIVGRTAQHLRAVVSVGKDEAIQEIRAKINRVTESRRLAGQVRSAGRCQ